MVSVLATKSETGLTEHLLSLLTWEPGLWAMSVPSSDCFLLCSYSVAECGALNFWFPFFCRSCATSTSPGSSPFSSSLLFHSSGSGSTRSAALGGQFGEFMSDDHILGCSLRLCLTCLGMTATTFLLLYSPDTVICVPRRAAGLHDKPGCNCRID